MNEQKGASWAFYRVVAASVALLFVLSVGAACWCSDQKGTDLPPFSLSRGPASGTVYCSSLPGPPASHLRDDERDGSNEADDCDSANAHDLVGR
jgi:hypothetical protein